MELQRTVFTWSLHCKTRNLYTMSLKISQLVSSLSSFLLYFSIFFSFFKYAILWHSCGVYASIAHRNIHEGYFYRILLSGNKTKTPISWITRKSTHKFLLNSSPSFRRVFHGIAYPQMDWLQHNLVGYSFLIIFQSRKYTLTLARALRKETKK